jgi:sugar fermentation stimulation protein A
LLEASGQPRCFVEVKNVTLKRESGPDRPVEFPDAVTARGAKHLAELSDMVREGHRAVMMYLVQRDDADWFTLADDIDPAYAEAFRQATAAGVEALCYQCRVSSRDIRISRAIRISVDVRTNR